MNTEKAADGIYHVSYNAPKLSRERNFTREYKKRVYDKTVDPQVHSLTDMIEMGQKAAAKGYENAGMRRVLGYNE